MNKLFALKDKKKELITILLGLSIVFGRVVIPKEFGVDFKIVMFYFILEIIVCGAIIYINREDVKDILKDFNYKKNSNFILKSIGLGILFFMSFNIFMIFVSSFYVLFLNGKPPINLLLSKIGNDFSSISPIVVFISQVVFCSIYEELVFRWSVRKLVSNDILFVLISALLFSFIHNFFYINWGLIVYFFMGLVFALAYLKVKDIRYMMGGHCFNNIIANVINWFKLLS